MVYRRELTVTTGGRGTYEITRQVARAVGEAQVADGLVNIWVRHTSASLIICENADPDVRSDLEAFFARLVPDGDPLFIHTTEGPDDMPAHARSVLTQTSITIPVAGGQMLLGTWQGLYLWEHRTSAHERRVLVTVLSG